MDQHLYEALKDRWEEVTKFLAGAAKILRAGQRPTAEWRTLTVPDLVAETFDRALYERTWNETRYPDVRDYLVSVAESIIGDSMRTKSARAEQSADRDVETSAKSTDQESELAAKELKEVVGAALKQDAEPALMLDILECFAADMDKPSDIAVVLGRPQHEVDVALRRFKRRAREALKEFKK